VPYCAALLAVCCEPFFSTITSLSLMHITMVCLNNLLLNSLLFHVVLCWYVLCAASVCVRSGEFEILLTNCATVCWTHSHELLLLVTKHRPCFANCKSRYFSDTFAWRRQH
jgi:hypothetical protein